MRTLRSVFSALRLLLATACALFAGAATYTSAASEPIAKTASGAHEPTFAAHRAPDTTERIIHVLSRLGYGPTLDSIDHVREIGIDAYIEEQLHPERIEESELDRKIASYESLGMSLAELGEEFQPVASRGRRARASGLEKRESMNEGRLDHVGLGLTGEPVDARTFRRIVREGRPGDVEVFQARFERGVHSRRQLLELMVDFWANHFSMQLGDHYYAAHYESQVIRPNALGKFEDILMATARHPAMLEYLDNYRSVAPEDVLDARTAELRLGGTADRLELRRRMTFLSEAEGLNENFAREIMELHTLGVDGGYTQRDVEELARCLTGWTIIGREGEGEFIFDPLLHEPGDKVVLGETIPSGGIDEGETVIRMLARHPSTARFISTKLVRRFIADEPPQEVVEAATATFLESEGDIREVLRTIFTAEEFFAPEYRRAKLKKPLELVLSAARALDASWSRSTPFNQVMNQLGERLYQREAPDGYPDVAEAWLNTNSLLVRIRFSFDLVSNQLPVPLTVDLDHAEQLLRLMEIEPPTDEQVAESRRLAAAAPEPDTEEEMGMSGQTMMSGGAAAEASAPEFTPRQLAIATMLGSPEFQKR